MLIAQFTIDILFDFNLYVFIILFWISSHRIRYDVRNI